MFITFKDGFRKHRGMWHFTYEEKKPGEAKLLARIETQVSLFLKLDWIFEKMQRKYLNSPRHKIDAQ